MDEQTIGRLIAEGASSSLAIVGGIQSLVDSRRINALEQFKEEIVDRISRLEQKVSDDAIVDLFHRASWSAARDCRELKLLILAAIVAGRYSGSVSEPIADALQRIVDELEPSEIKVLEIIWRHDYGSQNQDGDVPPGISQKDVLSHAIQALDVEESVAQDLVTGWLISLTSRGLLNSRMMSAKRLLRGVSLRGIMDRQTYMVSPLGRELIQLLDKHG